MSTVAVRFRDFWPGFEPGEFFLPLLQNAAPGARLEVRRSGPVDVEFVSVFPRWGELASTAVRSIERRIPRRFTERLSPAVAALPDKDAAVSIWYTGENVRPPAHEWDLTLSFDRTSEVTHNLYLPLWWLMFPELVGAGGRPSGNLGPLLVDRSIDDWESRPGFACAIIGNPEPVRMAAVRALGDIGPVDVLGRLTGKPVSSKLDTIRNYRYTICFENDVYPGYVTEKLVDAWQGGAIPLWNGLDPDGFVNSDALVNLAGLSGMDQLCERVAGLERDPVQARRITDSALLTRRPQMSAITERLRSLLEARGLV